MSDAARLIAFLDASVLYSAPLRDLLMHLAVRDLFAARWSDRVHEEWIAALLRNRRDLTQEQLARTRRLMDENINDALVSGYEHIVDQLTLPDADDRHVLAAEHVGVEVAVARGNGRLGLTLDGRGRCGTRPDHPRGDVHL